MLSRPKPLDLLILDGCGYSLERAVNSCLQRILDSLRSVGGGMLLTAGLDNIEQIRNDETGQPHTAHTMNQVPLEYVCGDKPLASGGSLSDLASTMLDTLGIPQPAELTGRSLLATH